MVWEWNAEYWMTGRAGRWLAAVVNVSLVLVIAHALALLTWSLVPERESAATLAAVPALSGFTAAVSPAASPADEIVKWQLFGAPPSAIPVQEPLAVPEDLPETNLKLRLVGVVASADARSGLAIIVDPTGEERPYQVGSELPGGAVLYAVQSDRVLLRRMGRLEVLKLPVESADGLIARGAAAQGVAGDADTALRALRDTLRTEPKDLVGKLNIAPVRQGGDMVGYRLSPGAEPALLAQLGLQPGDVVTSVNGVALDSAARGIEVMRQLARSEQVDVEVLRDGQPNSVSFNPGR